MLPVVTTSANTKYQGFALERAALNSFAVFFSNHNDSAVLNKTSEKSKSTNIQLFGASNNIKTDQKTETEGLDDSFCCYNQKNDSAVYNLTH